MNTRIIEKEQLQVPAGLEGATGASAALDVPSVAARAAGSAFHRALCRAGRTPTPPPLPPMASAFEARAQGAAALAAQLDAALADVARDEADASAAKRDAGAQEAYARAVAAATAPAGAKHAPSNKKPTRRAPERVTLHVRCAGVGIDVDFTNGGYAAAIICSGSWPQQAKYFYLQCICTCNPVAIWRQFAAA